MVFQLKELILWVHLHHYGRLYLHFPFYRIEPMEVLIQQAGKQAESYALTKNLVTYNFFGVLCLMLSIVAFGLYIWNSST